MKYYMAPMEGLTGYIYRNAYQKYFHDIDRYFTPFITNKKLDFKVKKDIDPEHNQGMEVVPQILTNQPDDFTVFLGSNKKDRKSIQYQSPFHPGRYGKECRNT